MRELDASVFLDDAGAIRLALWRHSHAAELKLGDVVVTDYFAAHMVLGAAAEI